ncbi:hypothetical protein [Variovorax sp. WS11]|uniref:hypothetical protein n=1 Tax=Variovorax sp. WS11 TaxID=1105204 RepID=UPI0013DBD6D6|nr:hypothetical protein [Variovorax sp. WS11]NDZ13574.1 hypothetical protein [Variovorax sp. WS11]
MTKPFAARRVVCNSEGSGNEPGRTHTRSLHGPLGSTIPKSLLLLLLHADEVIE